MSTSLLVSVALLVAVQQSCEQRSVQDAMATGPVPIQIGERIPSVITRQDRGCGTSDPCRSFQMTADKSGVLGASLTWPQYTDGLRLELWRGDRGDGVCCHSGERVLIPVTQGDRADIYVVFLATQRSRQAFELKTWLQAAEQ